MKNLFRIAIVPVIVMSMSIFAPMVSANCAQTGGCEPPPPCVKESMSCELPDPVSDYKPENYETSISFNDDDLGVSLQKGHDDAGSQYMDVYVMLDHGQNSNYLFTITQADLAPYADAHPAQNTLLASKDGVSVYILTTGEIQVNAGPDSEGKMHIKILNGIPWTTVYGYTIDPQ